MRNTGNLTPAVGSIANVTRPDEGGRAAEKEHVVKTSIRIKPARLKQLKIWAVEHETTSQQVIDDALAVYFAADGRD